MKKYLSIILFSLISVNIICQTERNCSIKGKVFSGNKIVDFAVVGIPALNVASECVAGQYQLENLQPGKYTIQASAVGY